MEFLMKYNITEEDIDEILKVNSKGIIKNIIINKNNVMEVIDYLLDLGVKEESIRDLFIYQIGIFFKSKQELMQAFEEYEMESILRSFSYDVNTIDMIDFD